MIAANWLVDPYKQQRSIAAADHPAKKPNEMEKGKHPWW